MAFKYKNVNRNILNIINIFLKEQDNWSKKYY